MANSESIASKLKNARKKRSGGITSNNAKFGKTRKAEESAESIEANGKSKLRTMTQELEPLEDPPATPDEARLSSNRLDFYFFDIPCEELAQRLLGKILVRRLEDGSLLKGKIVETESYLGAIDQASHTYRYRITPRNLPMYMPPGTIYVYSTYGMYHCFNISSRGDGCAVLVRAIEPTEGIDRMMRHRRLKSKAKAVTAETATSKQLKSHELCNGPSKLCMALELEKKHSRYSLCTWRGLWLEDSENAADIVKCPRIGIDSAGIEWASKPLRYYVYGNESISKRNKAAEKEVQNGRNSS